MFKPLATRFNPLATLFKPFAILFKPLATLFNTLATLFKPFATLFKPLATPFKLPANSLGRGYPCNYWKGIQIARLGALFSTKRRCAASLCGAQTPRGLAIRLQGFN